MKKLLLITLFLSVGGAFGMQMPEKLQKEVSAYEKELAHLNSEHGVTLDAWKSILPLIGVGGIPGAQMPADLERDVSVYEKERAQLYSKYQETINACMAWQRRNDNDKEVKRVKAEKTAVAILVGVGISDGTARMITGALTGVKPGHMVGLISK